MARSFGNFTLSSHTGDFMTVYQVYGIRNSSFIVKIVFQYIEGTQIGQMMEATASFHFMNGSTNNWMMEKKTNTNSYMVTNLGRHVQTASQ